MHIRVRPQTSLNVNELLSLLHYPHVGGPSPAGCSHASGATSRAAADCAVTARQTALLHVSLTAMHPTLPAALCASTRRHRVSTAQPVWSEQNIAGLAAFMAAGCATWCPAALQLPHHHPAPVFSVYLHYCAAGGPCAAICFRVRAGRCKHTCGTQPTHVDVRRGYQEDSPTRIKGPAAA